MKELMGKVNALEKEKFIETSVSLLLKCSIYHLINLPMENKTIADTKYFLRVSSKNQHFQVQLVA